MSRSLIMYRNTWPCYASEILIAATFKNFESLYLQTNRLSAPSLHRESTDSLICNMVFTETWTYVKLLIFIFF